MGEFDEPLMDDDPCEIDPIPDWSITRWYRRRETSFGIFTTILRKLEA